jgi:hypothetical protein
MGRRGMPDCHGPPSFANYRPSLGWERKRFSLGWRNDVGQGPLQEKFSDSKQLADIMDLLSELERQIKTIKGPVAVEVIDLTNVFRSKIIAALCKDSGKKPKHQA